MYSALAVQRKCLPGKIKVNSESPPKKEDNTFKEVTTPSVCVIKICMWKHQKNKI